MNQLTRTEAAVTTSSIAAAVGAILTLLVSFGLDLNQGQQAAILTAVTVLAPLVAGVITRRLVWSQESVEAKIAATAQAVSRGEQPPAP